jgi:hypothetical protein
MTELSRRSLTGGLTFRPKLLTLHFCKPSHNVVPILIGPAFCGRPELVKADDPVAIHIQCAKRAERAG